MHSLGIVEVDQLSEGTLLINFTDGTFASFSVDELAKLHPLRATAEGDCAAPGQDYL